MGRHGGHGLRPLLPPGLRHLLQQQRHGAGHQRRRGGLHHAAVLDEHIDGERQRGKGNFRIDNGTTEKLKEYLGSAPLSKDDTIEVRAIAQSTVGSISEARRIAYYRAMETRSQLIQAGFDSTRIIVKVRESVSPEDMDVVQVFKKS